MGQIRQLNATSQDLDMYSTLLRLLKQSLLAIAKTWLLCWMLKPTIICVLYQTVSLSHGFLYQTASLADDGNSRCRKSGTEFQCTQLCWKLGRAFDILKSPSKASPGARKE
jgi:hypothetical protein